MKDLGYGKNYQYAHDFEDAYVPGEVYFPDSLVGSQFYFPTDRGQEKSIAERLQRIRETVMRKGEA